jgi:hypothetical protein
MKLLTIRKYNMTFFMKFTCDAIGIHVNNGGTYAFSSHRPDCISGVAHRQSGSHRSTA